MLPIAAIDVGSNAVRMVISSYDPANGFLNEFENYREPIRLGGEVFSQGKISEDSIEKLAVAFVRFKGHADRHRVSQIRAVATSAMREARNAKEVSAEVFRRSGIKLEVIPGEEEARLVHMAVLNALDFKGKVALLLDIGGGSIEVSIVANDLILISESLAVGTVRLLHMLEGRKYGAKIFSRLVSEYVVGIKRQIKREIKGRKISYFIGTGGNIDALADLKKSLLNKKDSGFVTRKELDAIYDRIAEMPVESRISELGLRPDRADVIVPAIIILRNVMEHADVDQVEAPRVGLKEGILLEMFQGLGSKNKSDLRQQVMTYALEVGRKFSFDELHGVKVASLAVQLFDRTRKIHGQGAEERLLLEVAALLHDVGQYINQNDHHKHSYYLISATPMVGLSAQQRVVVGLIARYHRKALPKDSHEGFRELSPEDRRKVAFLAGILRLADAFDCQQNGNIEEFRVSINGTAVRASLTSKGDDLLERWAVSRKKDLFEQETGYEFLLTE